MLIIILILVICMCTLPSWGTHVSQVKTFTPKYGYANYRQFRREFDKREGKWTQLEGFDKSLKACDHEVQTLETSIHANIFTFNNIGMIMSNPLYYWLAIWHIRQYIKKNFPKTKEKIRLHQW